MNIQELFKALEEKAGRLSLDPEMTARIAFDITGSEAAQWHGVVEGGKAALHEGPLEEADISVSADSRVALGLYEKTINPMLAFATGKIKVRGDAAKIGLVKSLFGK